MAVALGLSLITFAIGLFIFKVSPQKAAAGFGFIGIMGFMGFSPMLFRKGKDKVCADERDLMILRKAGIVAYSIFWVLFVAAAMIPWFIIGPSGTITVNYLPWMVLGGMLVVMLMQSLVTLSEYGWRAKDE